MRNKWFNNLYIIDKFLFARWKVIDVQLLIFLQFMLFNGRHLSIFYLLKKLSVSLLLLPRRKVVYHFLNTVDEDHQIVKIELSENTLIRVNLNTNHKSDVPQSCSQICIDDVFIVENRVHELRAISGYKTSHT